MSMVLTQEEIPEKAEEKSSFQMLPILGLGIQIVTVLSRLTLQCTSEVV